MKYCWSRKRRYGILFLTVVLFLSGCQLETAHENGTEEIQADWTRGQVMAVVATERNRYQNVYTEQIWSAASGSEGQNFEDELMEQIQNFFTELTLVCAMAQEEELELSGRETDDLGILRGNIFPSFPEAIENFSRLLSRRYTICMRHITGLVGWCRR